MSTNHNLFEEKGEPKRYRTEVLRPLTSLTPRPNRLTLCQHCCFKYAFFFSPPDFLRVWILCVCGRKKGCLVGWSVALPLTQKPHVYWGREPSRTSTSTFTQLLSSEKSCEKHGSVELDPPGRPVRACIRKILMYRHRPIQTVDQSCICFQHWRIDISHIWLHTAISFVLCFLLSPPPPPPPSSQSLRSGHL